MSGGLEVWLHGSHLGQLSQQRNGSAHLHTKNYSMILRDGVFEMAPAYDLAPVFFVDSRFRDFGMRVAGQRRLPRINAEALAAEAASWGMPARRAQDIVVDTAEATRTGLAKADASGVFERIADQIQRRASAFAKEPAQDSPAKPETG